MPLRVTLQVESDLNQWGPAIRADLKARATDAMRRAVDGLKRDIRGQVASAGLGRRLGFAIGSELYPKAGVSLQPAGVIRPRGKSAESILESYTLGVKIRGKGGKWLAIPVRKNLPVLGRNIKPTPDLVERRLGRQLRWVNPAGGKRFALLVADTVTRGKSGKRVTGFGRNRALKERRSGKVETLVMFILVRDVQVRKRLDFGALGQKWADQLPGLMASARGKQGA